VAERRYPVIFSFEISARSTLGNFTWEILSLKRGFYTLLAFSSLRLTNSTTAS
jgi:hypothetical protein